MSVIVHACLLLPAADTAHPPASSGSPTEGEAQLGTLCGSLCGGGLSTRTDVPGDCVRADTCTNTYARVSRPGGRRPHARTRGWIGQVVGIPSRHPKMRGGSAGTNFLRTVDPTPACSAQGKVCVPKPHSSSFPADDERGVVTEWQGTRYH